MDITKQMFSFMGSVFGRLVQGFQFSHTVLFYSKPVSLVVFSTQFSQAAAPLVEPGPAVELLVCIFTHQGAAPEAHPELMDVPSLQLDSGCVSVPHYITLLNEKHEHRHRV